MYDLTLHRIRIFTMVVEHGGIGAAALALGVTQPSISAHLKALELTVRQPLIERRPGRAGALTEAGRLFYRYARDLVLETDNLVDILSSMSAGGRGSVAIGASRSVADFLLPPVLVEHRRRWPEVMTSLHSGTLLEVKRLLLGGTVGIGVVMSAERPDYFMSRQLCSEQLEVIVSPQHRLATRDRVSAADLSQETYVSALRSSPHYRMIDAILGRHEIGTRHRAMELDGATALKNVVRLGLGFAAVIHCTAADELDRGDLVALPVDPPLPSIGIWAVQLPKHQLTPAEHRFVDLALEILPVTASGKAALP